MELIDLKETKSIQYNGKCLRISSWTFVSMNFCIRGIKGDCDTRLALKLENGEELIVDSLEGIKNC